MYAVVLKRASPLQLTGTFCSQQSRVFLHSTLLTLCSGRFGCRVLLATSRPYLLGFSGSSYCDKHVSPGVVRSWETGQNSPGWECWADACCEEQLLQLVKCL